MKHLLALDREHYERQPKEGNVAWQSFKLYRDMGPERSYVKVAEALGKAEGTVSGVASEWSWKNRAAAWDLAMDKADREARLSAFEDAQTEMSEVAKKMWVAASEGLDMLLDEIRTARKNQAPCPVSPSELQKLADTGIKLYRLNTNNPTEIQETRHELTAKDKRNLLGKIFNNEDALRQLDNLGAMLQPAQNE